MRVSTWSCGTGSSGGMSSRAAIRCSARPFGVVAPAAPPRSASWVSKRIMPPKRRKSLILATAASDGSGWLSVIGQ